MNDDYLWDRSGTPDPDVERLEHVLARLRSAQGAPQLPKRPSAGWRRVVVPVLAAAAALLLVVVGWRAFAPAQPPSAWAVAALDGQPRVASGALAPTGRLRVGQTLETDGRSRARLTAEDVGEVIVDANSRVRLLAAVPGRHRLLLERGALQAFIVAPPGQFVVDTRSATAIDLGCVYRLEVGADGDGLLSVQAGWVGFTFGGRESFVPAGASCRTRRGAGPGTPRFDDAPAEFTRALDELDAAIDDGRRETALRQVLAAARGRDALTLWHLLARVPEVDRPAVFDALARIAPPPARAAREAILRLDRAALDAWWDALGMGDTTLWRSFERSLPEVTSPR